MTARRIATEIVLVASVVTVSVVTGVALGLRALDRWLSTPARPNHPDTVDWLEDIYHRPARKP